RDDVVTGVQTCALPIHAGAARQRDHLGERAPPAREHRNLVHAPPAAAEQLADRVPPPDAVFRHALFRHALLRVTRGPLGVSSTLKPRPWISSRSWSACLPSWGGRAWPRSCPSRSISGGAPEGS